MCYVLAAWSDPEPWGGHVKRRQFITLIGGVAVGGARGRLIACGGSACSGLSTKTVRKSFGAAIMQGLAELGWTQGRNLRDIEWFDFAGGL
jgi:hypothetical protein